MGSAESLKKLWNQMAAVGPDGSKQLKIPSAATLRMLYANGFVDAEKFTLEQWLAAFAPCRRSNGSYELSFEQWMRMARFHYDGPVGLPFEPARLRTGIFPLEYFRLLAQTALVLSSSLKEEIVARLETFARQQGLIQGDKITINQELKEEIDRLLRFFPSPLRVRQVDLAGRMSQFQKMQQPTAPTAVPRPKPTARPAPQGHDRELLNELDDLIKDDE